MAYQQTLRELVDIASNPKSQLDKYLSQDKKVVLCAPEYAPNEVIHSLGLIPMGAWGADTVLDKAKQYFPTFICSVVQSAVELGMRGAYEGASAFVVPYLCDSLKVLGENWKYAVPSIPFIPMPYPQNRQIEAGKDFVKASYQRVIDELRYITGASFNEEALANSIKLYNAHNAVMRDFAKAAAKYPGIGPVERSAVFKSAFFMEVKEHTAKVQEILAGLEAETADDTADGKIRIVTSGILADHPALLRILEISDFAVVGDDVAAESRQYLTDVPDATTTLDAGSALNSLAEKFSNMGNCSLLYDKDKLRIQRIVSLAQAEQADGVLVILTKFCDPEEFDIPFIQNACKAAGIPCLVLEIDRQMVDLGQLRTAVLGFKELLQD